MVTGACDGRVKATLGWKRMLPNPPLLHVEFLNTPIPIRINSISLPRTALGEEDGPLNVVTRDLGSTP